MKRLVYLTLALLLLFSLTSCGENKEKTKETEKTPAESSPYETVVESEDAPPNTVTDCYLIETSYGDKGYYFFEYNENNVLYSFSRLTVTEIQEEATQYVPTMKSIRSFNLYYHEVLSPAGENAFTGCFTDEDALTRTFVYKISGLDDEDAFKQFKNGTLIPWTDNNYKDFSSAFFANKAEMYGCQRVGDPSKIIIPDLHVITLPEKHCWLCLEENDSLRIFEPWDEELCEKCCAEAAKYDESVSACTSYPSFRCSNDSELFYLKTRENYYCQNCYDSYTYCTGCHKTEPETEYRKEYSDYYCDECYGDGSLTKCCRCSCLTDKTKSAEGLSGSAYCTDCFNTLTRCQYCSSIPADYREGLSNYYCDECFEKKNDCKSCNDPEKETSYREEFYYYYCDECYGNGDLLRCYNCAKLTDELTFIQAMQTEVCSDCVKRQSSCYVCGDLEKNATYYEESRRYYCDECYAEASICKECGDREKETEYHTDSYSYYCDECYAVVSVCFNCKDSSKETTYRFSHDHYYCYDCSGNSDLTICPNCHYMFEELIQYEPGEKDVCLDCHAILSVCFDCNDPSKETVFRTGDYGGYYFCDECFNKRIVCSDCFDGTKTAFLRDELERYYCDDCYNARVICWGCNDESKTTTYREEHYHHYCDDCYGDGSRQQCYFCFGLFDELIYNEYLEQSICEGCFEKRKA